MDTINYFIAETDLPQQSINMSYGPMSSSQYRVTSLFNGGSNPMAYAVTDGVIFIIDQINNSERVNLILKPEIIPFGAPVKYFIYRGLLKSDFLDINNSYNDVKAEALDDSEFIKKIRKGKNGLQALSLYNQLSDDYFIDNLFVNYDFQFALVRQGDSVGRFDSLLDYGFEIMLDETFFSPTLLIARKDINIIELSNVPEETDASRYQILNYIDPAAYYGLFAHSKFSIGTNNSTSPRSRKKEGVYEFIKRFATKNTIYIDLRDIYEYPIDWFEDSPKTIKFTTNGSSALSSQALAYRNLDLFPMKIINNGFSNVQTSSNDQEYFILKFSLPISNYATPLLTLHAGYWLKFVTEIKDDMNFSICSDNSGWSEDKEFVIFSINDASTDVPISSYVRLQLSEYVDIEAINNQIPDELGEEIETIFDLQGMFPFYINGIPEYKEPTS